MYDNKQTGSDRRIKTRFARTIIFTCEMKKKKSESRQIAWYCNCVILHLFIATVEIREFFFAYVIVQPMQMQKLRAKWERERDRKQSTMLNINIEKKFVYASHKGQCIAHSSCVEYECYTKTANCTLHSYTCYLEVSHDWIQHLNSRCGENNYYVLCVITVWLCFIRSNSECNCFSFIFTTWIAHLVNSRLH